MSEPRVLFQNDELTLVQSDEGYSLSFRKVIVFKSWPEVTKDKASGLLFLREGQLFLRNTRGESFMPESQLTEDTIKTLGDLFLLSLPGALANV